MDLNADVPKEILNKALEALEVAVKTGKIKKGTNEVTKAIERGNAKLVLVAKNVNPKEIIMHLPALCEEKDVPFVPVSTREELGSYSGLNIPTSAVAVIQEGDAKNLIKDLLSKLKK
ncbi:MAG TPA: 50S ribosomal protein L7Ae [Candidatus Nanoarchaeia archaeon]|nr:50S ribosomal protein L7Ae [Candidatus Nanoarchaeia archaeon]